MNAQQQDIIRLLTSLGPMTSRALFDIMQDELGYWSQASSNDQQSIAVEALSKILSKMKTANLLYGYMCPQENGRPVMVWSAPIADDYIAGVAEIPEDENPDDEHAEMESDIQNVCHADPIPEPYLFEIRQGLMTVKSGTVMRPKSMQIRQEWGPCVMLDGVVMIRNRAELAQFIGAIERMLP